MKELHRSEAHGARAVQPPLKAGYLGSPASRGTGLFPFALLLAGLGACQTPLPPVASNGPQTPWEACLATESAERRAACERALSCEAAGSDAGACEQAFQPEACEGQGVRPCFVLQSFTDTAFTCGRGKQHCEGGFWQRCEASSTRTLHQPLSALIVNAHSCHPCDPACFAMPHEPTSADVTETYAVNLRFDSERGALTLESAADGDGGGGGHALVDTDGDGVPDMFEPPECVTDPTCDGFTERGELFHVLKYQGPTRFSELEADVRLEAADVYLLMDTTDSMSGEIANLKASLTNGNFLVSPERCGLPAGTGAGSGHPAPPGYGGVIGALRCEIPNLGVGVGRFDDFHMGGLTQYGDRHCNVNGIPQGDLPFRNLSDIRQADAPDHINDLSSAIDTMHARCGVDYPESQVNALYALATGRGIYNTEWSGFYSIPDPTHVAVAEGETGDSMDYPYHLGDVTHTPRRFAFNMANMSDQHPNNRCLDHTSENGPDAAFTFTVSEEQEIYIAFASDFPGDPVPHRHQLRLYDADQSYLYCAIGKGGSTMDVNRAQIIQVLNPGTYHLLIDAHTVEDDMPFNFFIGPWTVPDAQASSPLLQPRSSCPAGTFGYPCFREDSIPIVLLLTDASMHNGPNGHNKYWMTAQTYDDAKYALKQRGMKVIGINSAEDPDYHRSCGTECTLSKPTNCVPDSYQHCTSWGTVSGSCVRCSQSGCGPISCPIRVCLSEETRVGEVCDSDCVAWSDYTCDYTADVPTSGNHLRQIAFDTGAVDADGEPLIYQVAADGTGLSEAVVSAISDLAGLSRMDISLRAVDNPSTTEDETRFVQSVSTRDTPYSSARCLTVLPSRYGGCLPDSDLKFDVAFSNNWLDPAGVQRTFTFNLEIVGDGVHVLRTIPVTVVVPDSTGSGGGPSLATEGRYRRDYAVDERCGPTDQRRLLPRWQAASWSADTTPADTEVRFSLRVADSEAALTTAPEITWDSATETSPMALAPLLSGVGMDGFASYARLTATLRASPDGTRAPFLHSMGLEFRCEPAD